MTGKTAIPFMVYILAIAIFTGAQTDSSYSGPPKIFAELGLAQMPDSLVFARSDSGSVQYSWCIRIRVFRTDTVRDTVPDPDVPDIFSLSIRYEEKPGDGVFTESAFVPCSWILERHGKHAVFYPVGPLEMARTDSSILIFSDLNPFFFDGADSIQVYGITDYISEKGYRMRDMTDYTPPGTKKRDRVGDIPDRRFDIRTVYLELRGLPD